MSVLALVVRLLMVSYLVILMYPYACAATSCTREDAFEDNIDIGLAHTLTFHLIMDVIECL